MPQPMPIFRCPVSHARHASGDAMPLETGAKNFVLLPQTLITRSDSRPGLGSIDCPALVVVGGDDRITPLELSEEIAANIPGSRLEIVADCGRLSTPERPEARTKVLGDWRSQ